MRGRSFNPLPEHLKEIQMPIPEVPKAASAFECLYGKHPAELLHRGTAYCRFHYDEKNLYGQLIN